MLTWVIRPLRSVFAGLGVWEISLPKSLRRSRRARRSLLIDANDVARRLTKDAAWHQGHGATGGFLGTGIIYYAMTYALKARVAVCLGSGGGFVPRIIRQAQRDIRLAGSRTILVDGNVPEAGWGSPQWLDHASFFRSEFPDVEILLKKSSVAAAEHFRPEGLRIDYLHIDADHSFEGCMADFEEYLPLMAERFVITIHDTDMPTLSRVVEAIRKRTELELVDFSEIGRGLALVRPKLPPDAPKRYEPYCT